ncbi:MAG: adenylosuccinate synthetase, partial [Myxococcales bacterium]|nr:adenylosuccinate synthetase [Myxococcales bacterium]
YTTRVGGGPLPTELTGEAGDRLREAGAEFGATTGRPRRCGWIDIPALRYAVRVNGIDSLAITKLDVLSGLGEIPICVAYDLDGEHLDEPPYDEHDLAEVVPVYEKFDGWTEKLDGARSLDALPAAARAYLARVESLVGVPISVVSVGADREQTFGAKNPFV